MLINIIFKTNGICNNTIKKAMQETKKLSIKNKCSEIENNIVRHNRKDAYNVVNDLTTEEKGKISTIQDKKGN